MEDTFSHAVDKLSIMQSKDIKQGVQKMNEENPPESIIQRSKIKLTKNSKGYGWELSVLDNTTEADLKRMKDMIGQLNDDMMDAYGGV